MSAVVTVKGIVTPDGMLDVPQKLSLPPGPVQVTVQSLTEAVQPARFRNMMESIWSDLRASGRPRRTVDEIDAGIDALRAEAEEEMQAVEHLQEECRRAREQVQAPAEQSH